MLPSSRWPLCAGQQVDVRNEPVETRIEIEDIDIFAHSLPDRPDTTDWEPLSEHLRAVGRRAAEFAAPFDAAMLGLAAGMLHDIGKRSPSYQRYIRTPGANRGPDHSTAGARAAAGEYGIVGRLMAFAIAGHHSGLMNGSGMRGKGRSLNERLDPGKYDIPAYDGWKDHVPGLPSAADLKARKPVEGDYPGFERAFLTRMLFSCLVDADFLETERFYEEAEGRAAPARGGVLTAAHLEQVDAYMAGHRRSDTPVNRLRSEILDHAVGKAGLPPGLFTLTVPTGGGKTLTSLNFAMKHALEHGLRRIVYVIPFTSIIEQTAAVFREKVGLGNHAVLEHHAGFDWDKREPGAENDAEGEGAAGLAKLRRDAENWDAPVVVTTAVQFFESLFAARTSRARKLHNLARSVIILDEAQTLPVHLLRPCMAAIDELARNYGTSVVLCTATQPALRKVDGALQPRVKGGPPEGLDIGEERELAPDPGRLYTALKRVEVEWRSDPVDDAEIAGRFAEQERMLCIVNSRAHARALFDAIAAQPGARHLTTLMCARHRRDVLAKVREDLAADRPVRLVSTSLIEAGVDVDFPEVWRAAAGLDSIAQASGRCNREGRLGMGMTVVFEPVDRKPPPAIEAFYQAARPVLRSGADPLGLDAVHAYFRQLYFQKGPDALDAATLDGEHYAIMKEIEDTRRKADFPFRSISDAFRLIDETMDPVLIPWDEEAVKALDALEYADAPPKGVMRKLQQYVVPVPAKARLALLAAGAAQAIKPAAYGDRFVRLISMDLYSSKFGLSWDDPTFRAAESNIFT